MSTTKTADTDSSTTGDQTSLLASADIPNGDSYEDRREIREIIESLGEEGVREHDRLMIWQPDGEFNFDLEAKVEGQGTLYRVRRKTVGELGDLLRSIKMEEGLCHNERQDPMPNFWLPLGAPLPPTTSAQAIVTPGGNEGWYLRIVLFDRERVLGGSTRYGQPMTWDVTTTKYHREDAARRVAETLNDRMWDLGNVTGAAAAWTRWHEQGRWESAAAETLRRIADHRATRRVRKEATAWEWPSDVRAEAIGAARTVGLEVAREILQVPDEMRWATTRLIPGQYA